MADDWAVLMMASNEPEAELIQQRLEDAEIRVVLQPGDASAYLGASGPVTVKVPADKLKQAKEVLQ